MKAEVSLLLFGFALNLCAQSQLGIITTSGTPTNSEPPALTAVYSVTSRGPNNRVWQRAVTTTNDVGQAATAIDSYTELATGLHYWDGTQWADSSDLIQITPNGAVASNTQHQVSFAGNINTAGSIDLTMPDGRHLRSQIIGLAYYDQATSNSVMFAETQDSAGQLLQSSNQVIYTNAFTDFKADIRYTHRRNGLEQDVILRSQPPSPASYGLNPQTTRLQIWTEFLTPPEPIIISSQIAAPTPGQPNLGRQTLNDEKLDFGAMQIGKGRAFSIEGLTNQPAPIPVAKQWVHAEGRTFLVEEVLLKSVARQIQTLPPPPSSGTNGTSGSGSGGASLQLKLPAPKLAAKEQRPLQLARAYFPAGTGLVLDYNIINASVTNFTFQADTTYYLSGTVNLYGTNFLEGGAVIKCADNSDGNTVVDGTIQCLTAPYRPAIFTATNDNSVGTVLATNLSAPTNVAVTTFLSINEGGSVTNVRFCYAWNALAGDGADIEVTDCQFINCNHPITMNGDTTTLGLHNVLITMDDAINNNSNSCGCYPGAITIYSSDINIYGEHVTADLGSQFLMVYFWYSPDTTMTTVSFTNSIIITPYLGAQDGFGGGPDGLDPSTNTTFYSSSLPSGFFQTVGAGNHYLLTNNPYCGYASTNNISPALVADLKTKTTHPPAFVFAGQSLSSNLTVTPQVSRDNGSYLDLGYHYDPIDYAFGDVTIATNVKITVTGGAVVAGFKTNSDNYSLLAAPGAQFISVGAPNALNHVVEFNMVQETSMSSNWSRLPSTGGGLILPNRTNAPTSAINCRFTDFSVFAQDTAYFYNVAGSTAPLNFQDCQFHGGLIYSTNATVNLTNCLLERVNATLQANDGNTPTIHNNLFRAGNLDLLFSSTNSVVENNLFDQTTISDHGISNYVGTYNGYLLNSNHLTLTNSHDVFLSSSPAYQVGTLGHYYQPTNDLLFHVGSTNASLLGLYQYTTQTNQTKEATNRVTIGYHYVTTDSAGNPVDSNGNGIPDYLEDANGSGGASITITNPANNASLSGPLTLSMQATISDWSSVVTNVQFFRGIILIGTVTNSPWQCSWSNVAPGIYTLTAVAHDTNGQVFTSAPVNIMVTGSCSSTYSATNSFGGTNGFLVNLNYTNSSGGLQLNSQWGGFNFLNLATGNSNTVLRLNTSNTTFVGEYLTAPVGKPAFPAHTVVDRYGNTWVANWDEAGHLDGTSNGSITEIGIVIGGTRGYKTNINTTNGTYTFVTNAGGQYLKPPFLYSTAVDRDGDGLIKTSFGQGNVLGWAMNTNISGWGNVTNAQDECIIKYVRVPAQLVSALALDTNNDLWVGGYCDDSTPDYTTNFVVSGKIHAKVSGVTGQVVSGSARRFMIGTNNAYGGFEAIVGTNGALWSSGGANTPTNQNASLVYYNPNAGVTNITTNGNSFFGMAVDPLTGNVWVTSYLSNHVYKFSATNSLQATYTHGDGSAGDLAIDNNSNVWVAHGPWFGTSPTIGHLRTDGTFLGNITLINTNSCSGTVFQASAVTIDAEGKVWAICASKTSSPNLVRIDPNGGPTVTNGGNTYKLGAVDFCMPVPNETDRESYGDMTGQRFAAGTSPYGLWDLTDDSGEAGKAWGTLSWNASTSDTNQVKIEVRAADQLSVLNSNSFQTVQDSVPLTNVVGEFLEVRVTLLLPQGSTNSPSLHDLTVACADTNNLPAVTIISPTNSSVFGPTPTNLTITATATSPNGPINWVEFYDGSSNFLGIALGPTTNNQYQITNWSGVTGGVYTLKAIAADSRTNATSAPVTVTLRNPPRVSITSPSNGAVFGPSPTNITISASASADSGLTIVSMQIFAGTNSLGTNASATNLTLTWSNVPAGQYALTAKAIDSSGASKVSAAVMVTVDPTNSPPVVNAGPNQTIWLPAFATLLGTVSNAINGLPLESSLSIQWTRTSGPGTVTFTNGNQAVATASFSTNGTNILWLTASNSQYVVSNSVTVIVLPPNQAPVVNAGTNQTVVIPANVFFTNNATTNAYQPNALTSEGKEFWLTFPQNYFDLSTNITTLTLFISSGTNTSGMIAVPALAFYTNFSVVAGVATPIVLPENVQLLNGSSNTITTLGIHVRANDDISIYGLSDHRYTTDAYLGLPARALGTNYIVLSYTALSVDVDYPAQTAIVGTAKGTTVSITPSAISHLSSTNFTINDGETYLLTTIYDMSGTIINSDKPIAVFAGNNLADVASETGDFLVEQFPPVTTWGSKFATMPLAQRAYGDTFRILASQSNTIVTIATPGGTVIDESAQTETNLLTITLTNSADFKEVMIDGASEITSTQPILVAQYANSQYYDHDRFGPGEDGLSDYYADPFMMIIPPYEQFLGNYVISTPTDGSTSGFPTNFINLIATNTAVSNIQIWLDGALIATTNFVPITNGLFGAQIETNNGSHSLWSTLPFGVFVYGWGLADGYGYPGGFSLAKLGSISNILLSPLAATNGLGSSFTITAAVTNQNNQPVAGVRVDFQVTGSNAVSGFAFTDRSGMARFSYAGTNLGVDIITATAGTNTTLATNTWLMPYFTLKGSIADDGLPSGITNANWMQLSGPSSTIVNSNATNTLVYYTAPGYYVYELRGDDTQLTNYSQVSVTVRQNQAPSVNAGANQSTAAATVTLNGSVVDDGLPNNTLSSTWSVVSGPGNVTFGNPAQPATTATFSSPGVYVLQLTASDSQASASATLTISNLLDPQAIQCGQLVNGNLTSSARRSLYLTNSYADYYQFTGNSNDLVIISMNSTSVDSYLFIYNTQLQPLAEDDDALGSTNSQIVYTLPKTGEYIIEASSYYSNSSGAYTLQFSCGSTPSVNILSPANGTDYTNVSGNVVINANAIAYADAVITNVAFYANGIYFGAVSSLSATNWTGSYTWTPGSAAFYTLTAVAKDSNGNSTTSAPVTINFGMPSLLLTNSSTACAEPTGSSVVLTATYKNGSGVHYGSGSNVVLIVAGANPTKITNSTDSSGTAYFTNVAVNVGADFITATNAIGGTTNISNRLEQDWAAPLFCGQLVTGSLASTGGNSTHGGYANFYSFSGSSNETVALTMLSTNFYTYLVLRDTNCNALATNDGYGWTGSQILQTLPADGVYIIEASSSLPQQTGSYTLELDCNTTNGAAGIAIFQGTNSVPNYGFVDFGTTPHGTPVTNILSITNTGSGALILGTLTISGDFSVVAQPTNTIPPNGSTLVKIGYNGQTNGAETGTLTFADNASGINVNPILINLTGLANPSGTPPTVSLAAPTNNSVFPSGTNITITATASATSGSSISNVQFFTTSTASGKTLIGQDATSPYGTTWAYPPSGTFALIASATDSAGRVTYSSPVNVRVLPQNTNLPPIANNDLEYILVNSRNNVFNVLANDSDAYGYSLTIVSTTAANIGGVSIINNGKALSYTPITNTAGGDYFYYTVSDGHGKTATARVTVSIPQPAMPTIVLTGPANGQNFAAGTTVTNAATVTVDPTSTAAVQFVVDNLLFATLTNAPYITNWGSFGGSSNNHSVYAIVTDSYGQQAMSSNISFTVTQSNTNDHPPIASIDNVTNLVLPNTANQNTTPIIRDGQFVMHGTALGNTNSADSIAYQINLYQPDGVTLVANLTAGSVTGDGFVHAIVPAGGILWTNDFTMIQNGPYILELVVEDTTTFMATNTAVSFVLDSGLKIGQFSFSQQDLTIPVNGLPLMVTRTYNSINPNLGDFGYGWMYSICDLQVSLAEGRVQHGDISDSDGSAFSTRSGGSRDVTLTLPNGQRTTFFYNLASAGGEGALFQPVWQAAPGVTATLQVQGAPVYNDILSFGDGSLAPPPFWDDYDGSINVLDENFDFQGFILKTADGTQYIINRQDMGTHGVGDGIQVHAFGNCFLSQIIEPSGDTITITTNGIFHADRSGNTNKTVLFQRQNGLITGISDPNGQATNGPLAVIYQYDSNTNLMNVLKLVDPNANAGQGAYVTNIFGYTNVHFPHYVTSIMDADGNTPLRTLYDDSGRMIGTVDAFGHTNTFIPNLSASTETVYDRNHNATIFSYDSRGNVTLTVDALSRSTQKFYDLSNNVTTNIDALTNHTYYAYDANNNILATTNALGFTNGMTYTNNVLLATSTDARGHTSTNYYDGNNNLIGTSDALGHTTTNFYDITTGLLFGSSDIVGTLTTNYYDSSLNLTSTATYVIISGNPVILSTNTFALDSNGNRTNQTVWRHANGVWRGATTTYVYDGQNRLVQTIDALNSTNTTVYDGNGKQIATIDALGSTTTYVYDAMSQLIATVYPDQSVEGTLYDPDGRRIASTNRLGYVTQYQYDTVGQLTNTIYPNLSTNSTIYDAVGQVQFSIDARGNSTGYGYDALGQQLSVTNGYGSPVATVMNYTYDQNGNRLTSVDGLNHTNTMVYDELNRVRTNLFQDGTMQITVYDAGGRKVSMTDQAANPTLFGYDGLGRLISVTNALQKVTSYAYDEAGNQTNQVDALGRRTVFEYDDLGRRTKRTLPFNGTNNLTESVAYDAVNDEIYHTDFNGIVITNQYDLMNRLTNRASAGGLLAAFSYTATGQRATMTDPSGTSHYVYDLRDRVCTNATPEGTLYYKYDANGNLTNMSSSSGGTQVGYQFDALNRLTNVLDGSLSTAVSNTTYSYDAVGNLHQMQYPNGMSNSCQYDSLNRLTNLVWAKGATNIASFLYQLGPTGNRTNLQEVMPGAVNRTNRWSYDAVYKLSLETISTNSTLKSLGYMYDDVGNRLARSATNFTDVGFMTNQAFTYDTNDWLTRDAYDNNGNTAGSAGTNYYYDAENRLTNMTCGSVSVMIVYNGDGQRVAKTVSNGVTTTTLYLVDTHNLTGYAQVLEELQPNGSTTNLMRGYTYGLSLISQRLLGTGGSTNFFGTDGHGSVRFLASTSSSVSDTFTYDAFGTLIASTGSNANNYLYCGEQWDWDIGLYFLRARHMNPNTGRFWTMDTTEGDSLDPLSLNKYLYSEADPVDGTDRSGHDLDSMLMPVYASVYHMLGAGGVQHKFVVVKGHKLSYGTLTGAGVWGQPAWSATGSSSIEDDTAYSDVTITTRTNPWGSGAGNSCNSIADPDPSGTIKLYLRNDYAGRCLVSIYSRIVLTGTGPQGIFRAKLFGGGRYLVPDSIGTEASPFGEANVFNFYAQVGTRWTLVAEYTPTTSIGPDKGIKSTATASGEIKYLGATADAK